MTAELLWLLPALPFLGAAVLGLFASKLPRAAVSVIGPGTVGLAAAVTAILGTRFVGSPPTGASTQVL